jgi:hypothetical protein
MPKGKGYKKAGGSSKKKGYSAPKKIKTFKKKGK